MSVIKTFLVPAAMFLAIIAVAVFGTDSTTNAGISTEVVENPAIVQGSYMQDIRDRGVLRVGTRFDHPGLSATNLRSEQEGFEIDLIEYVAAKLGLRTDQIEWVEASAKNREQFLVQDKVDMIVGTYTITDGRKKSISFAGPYATIAVDLVVPLDNPKKIVDPQTPQGIKICGTVGGAVSAAVREIYPDARLIQFDVSSKCIDALKNGTVDAYATQGPIGAGYVSTESEHMEMLGNSFASETWGVGIQKGEVEFCEFINSALHDAADDGSFDEAWALSLGQYSKEPMNLPETQPCS